MKKILLYSALLVGFAACDDKDKDPTPTPTTPTTRISMKVNGVLIEIENVAAWVKNTSTHGLSIASSDFDKNFIMSVHESHFTTGGANNIGGSNESKIQYSFKYRSGGSQALSGGKNLHGSHGTFTLTKTDNAPNSTTIKRFYGTFSGTLYSPTGNDSIVITEGQIIE